MKDEGEMRAAWKKTLKQTARTPAPVHTGGSFAAASAA